MAKSSTCSDPPLVFVCAGALTLMLAACCIYVPTLRYDMIFDDFPAIIENESIHELFPLFGEPDKHGPLNPKPNTPVSARPLVSLSLAINYHFSQTDPFGYRLTHLLLHLSTALILWAVVAATLRLSQLDNPWIMHRHPLAFIAAMLWLVHPAHNETVVYLTQRTELLMGLFYVLTIYLAIRFWECTNGIARSLWCAAAICSSTCGMLSKEMMASVPAMVFAYEWTFIGGSPWTIAKRSWLLYVGLALSWLPLVALYATGFNTPLGGFNNTVSAEDWWLTQSNSFFVYWRLLFFPWPLLLHYQVQTLHGFSVAWPGVIGISVYGLVTFYLFWRRTASGFALLWFFAVLSPTLIVPLPHEEISERRLYVPLLAMIPFLSIGSFVVLQRFRQGLVLGQLPSTIYAFVFVLVGVCTLPRLQDRRTIWQEVLEHQPNNMFALASQGSVEFNRGEIVAGLEKLQAAFDADPDYAFFRFLLTKALNELQLHDRLLVTSKRIYDLSPEDPICAYNLGVAFEKNGRAFEAMDAYRDVIKLMPMHGEAHANLATLLAEHHQMAEAGKHFAIATEIKPDYINCMNLMSVYVNTGQHEEAYSAAQKLLVAARNERTPEVVERVERVVREMDRRLRLADATQ